MTKDKITFDDIPTGGKGFVKIPDGYHGLDWDNFLGANPQTLGLSGSGFNAGTTSGQQIAVGGSTKMPGPATVSLENGTFTFKSVEMTAAWDTTLKVEVAAFDADGNMIHEKKVTLTDFSADAGEVQLDRRQRRPIHPTQGNA